MTVTPTLRDYQLDAVAACEKAAGDGRRRALVARSRKEASASSLAYLRRLCRVPVGVGVALTQGEVSDLIDALKVARLLRRAGLLPEKERSA